MSPEALLLPAMNLQKRIAARLIDTLPRTPPVGRLDEIETRLLRADHLRRRVGESVLGASVARVEQHLGENLESLPRDRLMGWLVFCIDLVGRTLDDFDPTARGEIEPRLDRRVALDTDKQIALLARHGTVHPAFDADGDRPLRNPCERFESIEFLGLPGWLIDRMDLLAADERGLLAARFGLDLEQPLLLAELCDRTGRSMRSVGGELARLLRRLHQ